MKTNFITSAASLFLKIICLWDLWILSNSHQKFRILTSVVLNVIDSSLKILGPLTLAKSIEMISESKDSTQCLGLELTAENLIYASIFLNLIHNLTPDLKKLLLYNIPESVSRLLSEEILDTSLRISAKTPRERSSPLIRLTSKHLCCADMEPTSFLSSVTESIHPMLFDTLIGVTVTYLRFGRDVGSILLTYMMITLITNEVLTYLTKLPARKSESMLLFNGFISQCYSTLYQSETIFLFDRTELERRNLSTLYSKYNDVKKLILRFERLWSSQAILTFSIQLMAAIYVTRNNFHNIDLDHLLFLFNYVMNIASNLSVINNSYRSSLVSINNINEIKKFIRNTNEKIKPVGTKRLLQDNTLKKPLLEARETENDMGYGSDQGDSDFALEFTEVSFRYNQRLDLISPMSFKIKPGETVAFVGESNCGKTTITRLIVGLLKPSDARSKIRFFGKDSKYIKEKELKELISIVRQGVESDIFENESLLYNILYGFSDDDTLYSIKNTNEAETEKIDPSLEESVKKAIQLAKLTHLSEKDSCLGLSGGEKQRLLIARIFERKAKIIIFDEPTSQLDSRTESELLDNLKKLFCGKTVIIIAHRLSTIRCADTIFVLKKTEAGTKIVEQGTHDDLIHLNGEYAELWRMQSRYGEETLPQPSNQLIV